MTTTTTTRFTHHYRHHDNENKNYLSDQVGMYTRIAPCQ